MGTSRYQSHILAILEGHFGRIDHSAGYGFWYSVYSGTVERVSATASANSYNEKSSKPHQSV